MKYFRFFPDCDYIAGPARGAIFHLAANRTIHLSGLETEIVNRMLENETIDAVEKRYPENARELLNRLIGEGIGTTYTTPVFSETYEPTISYRKDKFFDIPPRMRMAYIQLTASCDAGCTFCGSRGYLISNACVSCLRWPQNAGKTGLDSGCIDTFLKQLSDMETNGIVFSGGNPLLEWDTLVDTVKTAIDYRPSMKAMIHTNGGSFTDAVADDARSLNMGFAFTVLSDTREGYKEITGSAELFDSLLDAVKLCKKNGIRYGISTLICPDSHNGFGRIAQFAGELGGVFIKNCEVIPARGPRRPLASLPVGEQDGEKHFSFINKGDYFFSRHYNRCLSGKIAVSEDGKILPCPMWERPVGQFPEDDLSGVIREHKIQDLWLSTKSDVPTCRDCEYRYACSDCAVTEQYRKKDPAIHGAVCTYMPEKGEWVADAGTYRDQSLSTGIEDKLAI